MKFEKTKIVNCVHVISTKELCNRLGFTINVVKISEMTRVQPIMQRATGIPATYWRESDFKIICTRLAGALLNIGKGKIDITSDGFHP